MFQTQSCKRCKGSGFIPEYKHIENGICFSCRGTGEKIYNTNYPELNNLPKAQKESDMSTSEQNELIKEVEYLCENYNRYNSHLIEAEKEEDQDGIRFYDLRMNEIITKLYSLSKRLEESGVLIDNR